MPCDSSSTLQPPREREHESTHRPRVWLARCPDLHRSAGGRPQPGEVAIDVTHAGISFADVMFRRGQIPIGVPHVPGMEVSGVVAACGEGVEHVVPGQRVAALTLAGGGLSERVVTKADWTVALKGPTNVDQAQAAALPTNGLTAQGIIDGARLRDGESIAITAPVGGLGQLLLQLARHAGAAQVIAITDDAKKRAHALELGYSAAIPSGWDAVEAIREVTSGRGADVVIDSVGGQLRGHALELLATRGRYMVVGDAGNQDSTFSGNDLWGSNRSIGGFNLGSWANESPRDVRDRLHDLLVDAAAGRIEVSPQVADWSEVRQVHDGLESRRSTGKWVLTISDAPTTHDLAGATTKTDDEEGTR